MFEALIMNETNRSIALARVKKRISAALLVAPTDLALNVILSGIHDTAVNLDCLLGEIVSANPVFFLLIAGTLALFKGRGTKCSPLLAINIRLAQLSSVVLDLELDPAKLDNISLFQSVV
jgi:hypothetical protein